MKNKQPCDLQALMAKQKAETPSPDPAPSQDDSKVARFSALAAGLSALAAFFLAYNSFLARDLAERTYDQSVTITAHSTIKTFRDLLRKTETDYCNSDGKHIPYGYKLTTDYLLSILPLIDDHITSVDLVALSTLTWKVCDIDTRVALIDKAIKRSTSPQDLYAARLTQGHILYQKALLESDEKKRKAGISAADVSFTKALDQASKSSGALENSFLEVGVYRIWVQCRAATGDEGWEFARIPTANNGLQEVNLVSLRDETWDIFRPEERRQRQASDDMQVVSLYCIPRPKCPAEIGLVPLNLKHCSAKDGQPADSAEGGERLPGPEAAPVVSSPDQTGDDPEIEPLTQTAEHSGPQPTPAQPPVEPAKPETDQEAIGQDPGIAPAQGAQPVLRTIRVYNSTDFDQSIVINELETRVILAGEERDLSVELSPRLVVQKSNSQDPRGYSTSDFWPVNGRPPKIPVLKITSCCVHLIKIESR